MALRSDAAVGSWMLPGRVGVLRRGGEEKGRRAEEGGGDEVAVDDGADMSEAAATWGGELKIGLGGGEFSSEVGGAESLPDSTRGDDERESPSFAGRPPGRSASASVGGAGKSIEGRVTTGIGLGSRFRCSSCDVTATGTTANFSHGLALLVLSPVFSTFFSSETILFTSAPPRLFRVSSSRFASGPDAGRDARARPGGAVSDGQPTAAPRDKTQQTGCTDGSQRHQNFLVRLDLRLVAFDERRRTRRF